VTVGTLSANAGSNQSITLPANSATLTGSGSETNGTIVSYAWTQLSGPSQSSITTGNNSQTTVTGLVAGTYSYQLTVTDALGSTATATVSVTVNAHVPPVANAGPNQTTTAASVQLNGGGSYDTDGTIVSYNWTQLSGAGGVTIANSTSVTPVVFGLSTGTYVFQLTVTDNTGASASATVTITIGSGGGSGVFAVTGKDTTVNYPVGDTAVLNGSASYATGSTIASFAWSQLSGPSPIAIGNSSAAVTMVGGMSPGDYVFQLTVTNSVGDTSKAVMKVHVQNNERVTDHITLYPNPVLVGQQLTVTGVSGYAGLVKFAIIDMQGRVVKTVLLDKQGPDFVETINVSGLSRGTYVLWVQFYLDQRPYALKFVVD
jgi:hypothetical protein